MAKNQIDYAAIHHSYLMNLVHHLDYIDLKQKQISSLIIEPEWYWPNRQQRSLCDVIIGYNNGAKAALELKGSKKKRSKALNQLGHGKSFIETELNAEFEAGFFVVYNSPGNYFYEVYGPDLTLVRDYEH